MLKISNPRGEKAMVEGACVFGGWDAEAVSAALHQLQPIDTIYPPCAISNADARLCEVAKCCVMNKAPSLSPADDDERAAFRNVWDGCTELKDDMRLTVLEHVFSNELGVFAENVFVGHKFDMACVISFTRCRWDASIGFRVSLPYSEFCSRELTNIDHSKGQADMIAIRLSMQMAIIAAGRYEECPLDLPRAVFAESPCVVEELKDEGGNASLMLALRQRTQWFKDYVLGLPF